MCQRYVAHNLPYHLGCKRWLTILPIMLFLILWLLYLTVFTILIAFATDWFDVSGFFFFYDGCWDTVGKLFLRLSQCTELYISAFFFPVQVEKYLTFCHGTVTICSFYKIFIVVKHAGKWQPAHSDLWCSATNKPSWSAQLFSVFGTGFAVVTADRQFQPVYSRTLLQSCSQSQ